MKTMLSFTLALAFLLAPAADAQTMKLGEVLVVSDVSLKADADHDGYEAYFVDEVAPAWNANAPGTELHLFRADRGAREGDYLRVWTTDLAHRRDTYPAPGNGAPFDPRLLRDSGIDLDRHASYVSQQGSYTEYVLVEASPDLPSVDILGIHNIAIKPGSEAAFERLVRDSINDALAGRTPGMHVIYYKGVRGDRAGQYIALYAIESVTDRIRYWPAGTPETEALKSAFRPLTPLARQLEPYLVEGSYLEAGSGAAAAIFESLDWTDFVHVAAKRRTADDPPAGFTTLFDGKSLDGWMIPNGDNGHWKVVDGVIDYDAESEAPDDKSLWTERSFEDFVLYVDWRIKETPWENPRVPLILPSGLHKLNEHGEEIRITVPDSDSGILFRGPNQAQANIWGWPIGSGEVYGYRMDPDMPPDVRAAATPKVNADQNIGEWNTFKITVHADTLTVELNGVTVIDSAWLPDLPRSGPIGLQHHGYKEGGEWVSPPSLVQFRRIFVKEL